MSGVTLGKTEPTVQTQPPITVHLFTYSYILHQIGLICNVLAGQTLVYNCYGKDKWFCNMIDFPYLSLYKKKKYLK